MVIGFHAPKGSESMAYWRKGKWFNATDKQDFSHVISVPMHRIKHMDANGDVVNRTENPAYLAYKVPCCIKHHTT